MIFTFYLPKIMFFFSFFLSFFFFFFFFFWERGKDSVEVFRIWKSFFDLVLNFLGFEVSIRALISNIYVVHWSCHIEYVCSQTSLKKKKNNLLNLATKYWMVVDKDNTLSDWIKPFVFKCAYLYGLCKNQLLQTKYPQVREWQSANPGKFWLKRHLLVPCGAMQSLRYKKIQYYDPVFI